MILKLTVTGFKKGNRAVRSSTGPVGFFTANTSISFHIALEDNSERTVMSLNATSNNRFDTESLDIAKTVAGTVSKRIAKVTVKLNSRKHNA